MGAWGSGIFDTDPSLDLVGDVVRGSTSISSLMKPAKMMVQHFRRGEPIYGNVQYDLTITGVVAEFAYASRKGTDRFLPQGELYDGLLDKVKKMRFTDDQIRLLVEGLRIGILINNVNVFAWVEPRFMQEYTANLTRVRNRLKRILSS